MAATPRPEESLDVRDDEVVWGTSEESIELASESEGGELIEPTAVLSTEEVEVVSESDDNSPSVVSTAPTQEEGSRSRRASEAGDAPPALLGGTDDNSESDAKTAASASTVSPSVTRDETSVEEGNAPAVAENGSYYGEISPTTGRPKTVNVRGYYRKDGTYIRGHYRSAPRRGN
jgi:hypothetical protein